MKGLTKRQREILDFIEQFLEKHRFSPSFREIQRHFSFNSLGSVHKHLEALKRKGYLQSESHCSRSLSLSGTAASGGTQGLEVPLMGQLSETNGIETFSKIQTVSVPEALVKDEELTYALRVKGDFLAEEMIAHGDLMLVEVRPEAASGEMALCLVNHTDFCLKRYFSEGQYIRLESSNPQIHPMTLPENDVEVRAVLVGLLRAY